MILIGHRGAAGTAPENTLLSVLYAIEFGVDAVAVDVRITADGHPVAIHDPTLDRTTTGSGWVHHHTLTQIRTCDAGSWKGRSCAGTLVPTLEEVLWVIAPTRAQLILNLNVERGQSPATTRSLLARTGMAGRTEVVSFDHRLLARLREADPAPALGIRYTGQLLDSVEMARAVGAATLHPDWHYTRPEDVQAAQRAGLRVVAWNVNHRAAADYVGSLQVDGVVTDYPERLQAALAV